MFVSYALTLNKAHRPEQGEMSILLILPAMYTILLLKLKSDWQQNFICLYLCLMK